jgi:hypothetical protein
VARVHEVAVQTFRVGKVVGVDAGADAGGEVEEREAVGVALGRWRNGRCGHVGGGGGDHDDDCCARWDEVCELAMRGWLLLRSVKYVSERCVNVASFGASE